MTSFAERRRHEEKKESEGRSQKAEQIYRENSKTSLSAFIDGITRITGSDRLFIPVIQ
jgi:hypothetical protein